MMEVTVEPARRLKSAAEALRRGSGSVALATIRPALIADPGFVNATILAAMAQRTAGSPVAALRLFRCALALDPGNPHARAALGELGVTDRPRQATAAALLAQARGQPTSPGGWITLGLAALSGEDVATAWSALRRACMLRPGDRSAVPLMILAERRRSGRVDWLALASRAIVVGPATAAGLEAALIACREGRDGPRITSTARRLLMVAPDTGGAQQALAVMADVALRSRDRRLAARLASWSEVMVPGGQANAAVRARLLRAEGRLAEAAGYLRARVAAGPEQPGAVGLSFDLASILDEEGDTAGAVAALVDANAKASRRAAAQGADRRRFLRQLDRFLPAIPAATPASRLPADGPAPVFLFGVPRSGTTLVGDILHRHPCVETLDEREMLPNTVWAENARLRSRGIDIADVIAGRQPLPEADRDAMRASFRRLLRREARAAGRPMKIDKSPFGILYAGLVAQIFPEARILFALRHPADVCLSCLMQEFSSTDALVSFTSVAETAELYDRIMTFWMQARAAFPLAVHTVRYEALVADPVVESRRVTDFLGLEWGPELLDPGRTAGRYTATPSFRQVGRPIGGGAIGRWKRYRDYLAPAWPLLEPWIRRLGYDDA